MPTPAPEICDGRDNDCDGAIDGLSRPCYPALVVGCDVRTGRCTGTCALGVEHCPRLSVPAETNAFGGCLDAVIPRSEICDGLDDDCNGIVDDALGGCPPGCADGGCTADAAPDAAEPQTDAAADLELTDGSDATGGERPEAGDTSDAGADSPIAAADADPTLTPRDAGDEPEVPAVDAGGDGPRPAAGAAGCGCRLTTAAATPPPAAFALLLLGSLIAWRRRR